MVDGLPLESALARSVDTSGRLSMGWTTQTELTALVVEMLDRHTRTYLSGNGVKPHEMPKPVKIPRPDDRAPSPASPAAVRGFFAKRGVPILPSRKKRDRK